MPSMQAAMRAVMNNSPRIKLSSHMQYAPNAFIIYLVYINGFLLPWL